VSAEPAIPPLQSELPLDGRLPLVWLRLFSDGTRLLVEVWDTAPGQAGTRACRLPPSQPIGVSG
jgi:hypothetical protein